MGNNLKGIGLALIGCALYSAHDAVIKGLGGALSTVQVAFFAALLALPLILGMLVADRGNGTLRPVHPRWILLRSVAVVVAMLGAFYAFRVLPLAQAYTILFAAPLLIAVLSVPLLGEPLRWRRATAVLVGLAGVLVVLRPGAGELNLGHAAALISALANALVHITSRRVGGQERLPVMILYPMLLVVVLMGLALPGAFQPITGAAFTGVTIVAVLSFAAMLCLVQGFKLAEAALVAPMQYSQLIWGILLGAMFFDEWPAGNTLAGAVLIIGSGIYIVLREARLPAGPPAPAGDQRI